MARYGIDCDFAPHRRAGRGDRADYQVAELRAGRRRPRASSSTGTRCRAEVDSPTYLAGCWDRDGTAMVDPARLAWGLAARGRGRWACGSSSTPPSLDVARDGPGAARCAPRTARCRADQVALGTNAFPSLLRRLRLHTVPVYDYVLMTEPLSPRAAATRSAGRTGRASATAPTSSTTTGCTADNRILWGGYDAVYHFGGRVRAALRPAPGHVRARWPSTSSTTFPQLDGLRFTHRWGGAIDTCTRFCAFFGTAYGGRVAYAPATPASASGATRFGADVMLDLLAGEPTERTELRMVRTQAAAVPARAARLGRHPGHPLVARARPTATQGRRNLWLRTLDRLGPRLRLLTARLRIAVTVGLSPLDIMREHVLPHGTGTKGSRAW